MLRLSLSTQRLAQAILLAGLSVLWATNAQAAEQRCTDLGANCLCSEPLQMTAIADLTDGKRDPNDSTTKECHTDGVNHAGFISHGTPIISTDAAALAAFPAGHGVARFLRRNDNHDGMYFVGGTGTIGTTALDPKYVRIAARWYIYRTPTFDFARENTCQNSKIAQMDGGVVSDYDGKFHLYNYVTWSPAIDCCMHGPGGNPAQSSAQFKGKWWRYEIVISPRSGPGTNIQMYIKNVTDNRSEIKVADMSMDSRTKNLSPPVLMSRILSNNHRFAGTTGICRGWVGISHYVFAGWTTNAGQRIGPALEIEGANIPKPPPPINLRVQ